MTRTPATFRKADLRRAVEAVTAAGQIVKRVEVDPNGKMPPASLSSGRAVNGTASEAAEVRPWFRRSTRKAAVLFPPPRLRNQALAGPTVQLGVHAGLRVCHGRSAAPGRCRQGAARNDDGAGHKLFRFA